MPRIDLRTSNFPDEKPHAWPSPESWPAAKVRETFVKYFTEAKPGLEHTFWPSSNVIPFEDPTLLFANAVSLRFLSTKLLSFVCMRLTINIRVLFRV